MSKRAVWASTTTSTHEVLDALARQLSLVDHDELTRHVVVESIAYLEWLAQATLGSTHGDPTVLLMRRFARAHRRLLVQPELLDCQLEQLGEFGQALGDPAAALLASCQSSVEAPLLEPPPPSSARAL